MFVIAKFSSKIREIPLMSAPEIERTVPNRKYRGTLIKDWYRLFDLNGGGCIGWVPAEFNGVRVFRD